MRCEIAESRSGPCCAGIPISHEQDREEDNHSHLSIPPTAPNGAVSLRGALVAATLTGPATAGSFECDATRRQVALFLIKPGLLATGVAGHG